jgi:hypothetical protein
MRDDSVALAHTRQTHVIADEAPIRQRQCPKSRQSHSENGHCRRCIFTVNHYNVVVSIGPYNATFSYNGGNL